MRTRLLLLVPLLAASAWLDPEDVTRQGDLAFAAGDYARAVTLYEKAELHTTQPSLVAFNLATANFALARENGSTSHLLAAEQGYRCCIGAGDPRRARALFGVATCMLQRGGSSADPLVLRSAIDAYTACLRDPTCDTVLAADARFNRQRAQLLLLQTPPSSEPPQEEPPGEEDRDKPSDNQRQQEKKEDGKEGPGEQKSKPGNAPEEKNGGDASKEKPQEGPSGRAGLPPISDQPDGPDVSQPDAAKHLEQARKRIVAEMQEHRRGRKRPAPVGARDW